jgi:ABC-type transport system involved in multi-copper enzyme maturation permease subunit
MSWLFWKEYRNNRLIVFTTLFLLVAPHLVAVYAVCRAETLGSEPRWQEAFVMSSQFSLMLAQVGIAMIGGNAIAGERVDRSAEFLFALPVTRTSLVASKLLLASIVVATIWLTTAPVLLWLTGPWKPGMGAGAGYEGLIHGCTYIAITGMTFFCVAWFLSSLVGSPTFAVAGGFAIPLLFGGGVWLIYGLFDWMLVDDVLASWYWTFCLTISPPCFAIGTWLYLRRVEP